MKVACLKFCIGEGSKKQHRVLESYCLTLRTSVRSAAVFSCSAFLYVPSGARRFFSSGFFERGGDKSSRFLKQVRNVFKNETMRDFFQRRRPTQKFQKIIPENI